MKAAAKAVTAEKDNSNSNSKPKKKGKGGNKPKCEHYNTPWHSSENCWLTHTEKITQEWRNNNKDRIAEFKKKKTDIKDNKEKKKEKAYCAINTSIKDSGFYFDTAASLYYVYFKAWFNDDSKLLDEPVEVEACDGSILYATYVGMIKLDTIIINQEGDDEECSLTIKDVYYCPDMSTNLISLGTLVRNGLSFKATKKRLTVIDDDGDIIMEGALVDTLFKLRLSKFDDSKAKTVAKALVAKNSTIQRALAKYWHETIDHFNYSDLAKLPKIVEGM